MKEKEGKERKKNIKVEWMVIKSMVLSDWKCIIKVVFKWLTLNYHFGRHREKESARERKKVKWECLLPFDPSIKK